jgi:hypothetical protein
MRPSQLAQQCNMLLLAYLYLMSSFNPRRHTPTHPHNTARNKNLYAFSGTCCIVV